MYIYIYTQTKSRKTEKGLTERSKTDKKRERRLKKRFQHLHKEKMQASKEKLEEQLLKKKSVRVVNKDTEAIKSSETMEWYIVIYVCKCLLQVHKRHTQLF